MYTIVMTACVQPAETGIRVSRSDPQVRLQDYLQSVEAWLAMDDPDCEQVIFLENSGYPLDEVRRLGDSPLALRPLIAAHVGDNAVPEGVSYGYAELGMLDAASQSLGAWASADLLVKATGRLRFPALPRLIDRVGAGVQFLGDARNRSLPRYRTSENGVITTQLLAFTPDFYGDHMLGLREAMRPAMGHRLIESVIYRQLFPLEDGRRVRFRFPVSCDPLGHAGHWEKQYQSGADLSKSKARSLSRAIVPWWWG
ncbi:hypothetical protein OHB93_08060 [Microbacterium sp. No. 7]|uniref:hypothetical protein n=1 Tax=Microbacterium sp. No. 7 TaxID=1714373 RepID=UPI00300BD72F